MRLTVQISAIVLATAIALAGFASTAVAPTPHTLEVRNLGTAGRSRVDVDAFVVLR